MGKEGKNNEFKDIKINFNNEYDYYHSVQMLKGLLERNLITIEEFNVFKAEYKAKYKPIYYLFSE